MRGPTELTRVCVPSSIGKGRVHLLPGRSGKRAVCSSPLTLLFPGLLALPTSAEAPPLPHLPLRQAEGKDGGLRRGCGGGG